MARILAEQEKIKGREQVHLIEKDGSAYLVHPVRITDSLQSIGLTYNVNSKLIMKANQLLNEQIF